jgi:hypothetical protein
MICRKGQADYFAKVHAFFFKFPKTNQSQHDVKAHRD